MNSVWEIGLEVLFLVVLVIILLVKIAFSTNSK